MEQVQIRFRQTQWILTRPPWIAPITPHQHGLSCEKFVPWFRGEKAYVTHPTSICPPRPLLLPALIISSQIEEGDYLLLLLTLDGLPQQVIALLIRKGFANILGGHT